MTPVTLHALLVANLQTKSSSCQKMNTLVEPIILYPKIIVSIIYGTSGWVCWKLPYKKLQAHLKQDLDHIASHLHIACFLSELFQQVDKEYSKKSNHMKGHGRVFKGWLIWYHPVKQYLPAIQVLGKNRQDAAFEGSLPVYDGLDDMLAFTHVWLLAGENVFQCLLFLSLGSMVVVPNFVLQWLCIWLWYCQCIGLPAPPITLQLQQGGMINGAHNWPTVWCLCWSSNEPRAFASGRLHYKHLLATLQSVIWAQRTPWLL